MLNLLDVNEAFIKLSKTFSFPCFGEKDSV